jgi:hypothetical protein
MSQRKQGFAFEQNRDEELWWLIFPLTISSLQR